MHRTPPRARHVLSTRTPLRIRLALASALVAVHALAPLVRPLAAQAVPSPREVLGFEPGADRTLADWPQITGYFDRLARA